MASPHVTGAISLIQGLNPALTRAEINTLLTDYGVDCTGCQGKKALKIDVLLADLSENGPIVEPEPVPAPTDDEFEPNNDFTGAPTVTCGASLELFMASGDIDWFLLDTAGLTSAAIAVDAGAQDLDIYITDGPTNEDVIALSTTETGQEFVNLPATGGIIGIAVVPWEAATGPYTLDVTCVVPAQPEPEPTPEPEPEATPEPDPKPVDGDAGTSEPVDDDAGTSEPVDDDAGALDPGDDDDERSLDPEETGERRVTAGGCAQSAPSDHTLLALLSVVAWTVLRRRRR
jgi:hypothetical protein